jgi:hypothetical protein
MENSEGRNLRKQVMENRLPAVGRRSGRDRRRVYDFDYFLNGGVERRGWLERRSQAERRAGWRSVSKWASAPIHD